MRFYSPSNLSMLNFFSILLLICKNVVLNRLKRLPEGRSLNLWLLLHMLILMSIMQRKWAFLISLDIDCGKRCKMFYRSGLVRKVRTIIRYVQIR